MAQSSAPLGQLSVICHCRLDLSFFNFFAPIFKTLIFFKDLFILSITKELISTGGGKVVYPRDSSYRESKRASILGLCSFGLY